MMRRCLLAAGLILGGAHAFAEGAPPRVATDIPPVHSLVAAVMAGRGAPDLAVPPGASPHGYAMRPSQAEALAEADLVVWVGPRLAPWFGEAVAALAPAAPRLALMEAPGAVLLPMREDASFGGGHAGHDHGHGHGHDDDDDHATEGMDEHVWLDPRNAVVWLGAIAEALAAVDPAGAALYRANAAAKAAEIAALEADLAARLAPVRDRPFVVFHDAYQYFEARFGLAAIGAVAMSDARAPGAARVSAIRERLRESGAACVFSEPQFSPRLVATVVEGTDARAGVLDPLGADLAPGSDLYAALLRGLADALTDCLGDD